MLHIQSYSCRIVKVCISFGMNYFSKYTHRSTLSIGLELLHSLHRPTGVDSKSN